MKYSLGGFGVFVFICKYCTVVYTLPFPASLLFECTSFPQLLTTTSGANPQDAAVGSKPKQVAPFADR